MEPEDNATSEDKESTERGKNRGGRELGSSKDLCVISENCRDLFVKQNFPLI
jgi:hypothetical protein